MEQPIRKPNNNIGKQSRRGINTNYDDDAKLYLKLGHVRSSRASILQTPPLALFTTQPQLSKDVE